MPRYFFHVEDQRQLPDRVGTDLSDLDAARAEAVRLAGALVHDDAATFWETGDWRLIVTDERQTVQFVLQFAATVPAGPVTYDPERAAKNE